MCNKPSLDGKTHPICTGTYTIDGSFASIIYEGAAKKLIYTFKYKPYVTALKNVLIDLFYEGIIQKEAVSTIFSQTPPERVYFTPIPLHAVKLRERGYNHASILGEGLAQKLGLQTKALLQRVKKTQSQKNLLSADRKKNIEGAFVINQYCHAELDSASSHTKIPKRLACRQAGVRDDISIFLIDDIVTSGATFQEAAKILKRAGYKKVYGLALARGR